MNYCNDIRLSILSSNAHLNKNGKSSHHSSEDGRAVYCVALIKSRGSSLVVTHRTADVRVTSNIQVTIGLFPAKLSTIISGSHAATYIVNTCLS